MTTDTLSSSTLRLVGVLDTAVATLNYGDHIIMSGARAAVGRALPEHHQISLPTHDRIGIHGLREQRRAEFNIACGTNLLHAHMGLVQQWRLGPLAAAALRPVVLLGVGWRSHPRRKTDPYTRLLLRRTLSHTHLHSVRDSYAERRLREIGFDNVVNTGCPTLWGLDAAHCARIPTQRAQDAVVVLTDYSRNDHHDQALLDRVLESYRNVYFWPQGEGDIAYLQRLNGSSRVRTLPRNLRAYDELLEDASLSLDYVGTRLHGGIRALQKGRRAIIVGVDHRALTMGKDFDLPVINRYADDETLAERIHGDWPTAVSLPSRAIAQWRDQFSR